MLTQVGSVRCSVFRFQLPGWAADGIGEMDNGGKAWSVSGGLTEFCRWLTMQGEGASCVNTLCTKLLCRMLTQVWRVRLAAAEVGSVLTVRHNMLSFDAHLFRSFGVGACHTLAKGAMPQARLSHGPTVRLRHNGQPTIDG